jgi:uncharacterized phiE125 gp8 family phage protein
MENNSNIWNGAGNMRDVDTGENQGLSLSVVTPSSVMPISRDEFKEYGNVHITSDDSLIDDIIRAVKEYAQDFTRTTWFTTTYQAEWERHAESVDLPVGPHQEVLEVIRVYADGTEQVLTAGDNYRVTGQAFKTLHFGIWGYGLKVRFRAGYGSNAGDLPLDLKLGTYKAVLSAYEDRQNLAEGSFSKLPAGTWGFLSGKRRIIL